MRLLKRLIHRHTWRPLKTEYRYHSGCKSVSVKRCQCRECGKIEHIHFNGKDIVY